MEPNSLDTSLLALFRVFIKDALANLAQISPTRFLERIVITTSRGRLTAERVPVPAWQTVVHSANDRLKGLASYQELQDSLLKNEAVVSRANQMQRRSDGRPLTVEDLRNFYDWHVITRLLMNYLNITDSCVFSEGTFVEVCAPLEQHLIAGSCPIVATTLLYSFIGPENTIQVSEGVTISKATDQEMTALAEKADYDWRSFSDRRWILNAERVGSMESGHGNLVGLIERIIQAMRLTKHGSVYCGNILTTRRGETMERSFVPCPKAHVNCVSDFSSEADISEFVSLLQSVPKVDRSLAFPFRTFNRAFERSKVEDRFVDIVIALEAIFVQDGPTGEIGYKFRMRMARYLADCGVEAFHGRTAEIASIAKIAYSIRSAIVHGATDRIESEIRKLVPFGIGTLDKLTDTIEEYGRAALKELIRNPGDRSVEKLDARLLSTASSPSVG